MAPYADLDDLVGLLEQLEARPELEGVLSDILDRATSKVNILLGVSATLTSATSGTAVVRGNGTTQLRLPFHSGTITSGAVTAPTGYSVPTYAYVDGSLVIVDTSGVQLSPFTSGIPWSRSWFTTSLVWAYGVPYTVTGTWGASADDLNILKTATLQLATQEWRYKDAGGSETVGAEGAITTVREGINGDTRRALMEIRRRIHGSGVVW